MIVANLTMSLAKLALARSVNYNCKVCCKLNCTFMIVNYDPKPFIVQATGQNSYLWILLLLRSRAKLAHLTNIKIKFCSQKLASLMRKWTLKSAV
jgi:hypothetical protein